MEANLVAIWTQTHPRRWVAGAFTGLFAGVVMIAVAMLLAVSLGYESWAPVKLPATIFLGSEAMRVGMNTAAIGTGFLVHELFCMFLGFVFSHFVYTNDLKSLLGMGLTWGTFGWIFVNNLFSPSFEGYRMMNVPSGAAFVAWMAFGVAMISMAFFDRLINSKN